MQGKWQVLRDNYGFPLAIMYEGVSIVIVTSCVRTEEFIDQLTAQLNASGIIPIGYEKHKTITGG